jgi:hypothetical protein
LELQQYLKKSGGSFLFIAHWSETGRQGARRKFNSHLRMSLSPTQRRRDGELGGGVLTDDEKIDKIFPNIGNNGNK